LVRPKVDSYVFDLLLTGVEAEVSLSHFYPILLSQLLVLVLFDYLGDDQEDDTEDGDSL
jgi:hypothetical protein